MKQTDSWYLFEITGQLMPNNLLEIYKKMYYTAN